MKNATVLLALLLIFSCCTKDEVKVQTETEKLTPATQTGANTFSCLLDGQIFKPGVTNNSYQCFYQLVNGQYYFNVNANNQKSGVLKSIGVATEQKIINTGQTYSLIEHINGNAYGIFYIGNSLTGIDDLMYTSIVRTGELKITKLSYNPNIVSGTFWFDVKDNQNVVHQIRDGRFDMQFTQ